MLTIGLLMTPALLAEEPWLERSREILESSKQQPMPEWLKEAMHPKADVGGFRRPEAMDLGLPHSETREPKGPRTYIFVSQSLGQEMLREIVWENRGHKDRVIVFRGFSEGQSLKGFVATFRSLIEGMDRKEIPPITIDPERFAQHGITQVPAIVRDDPKGNRHTVSGIHQVEWIDRQISISPVSMDYGQRGETVAIAEPDLLEKVKERARTFNWAAYKQDAQDHFWQDAQFESLPEALSDREFWFDPTYTVPRDLTDTKGHVIAVAGQRVNPLETFPFHQKLIVFNGARPSEVDWVFAKLKNQTPNRITLITTEIDRNTGWSGLQTLQKKLGGRVFLLNPAIRKRFKLAATPSIVESVDRKFRVREIGMRNGR
jgi:conjugal transfer pilus assembly protein TraW